MSIKPITTECGQALAAHLRLGIEAWELQKLQDYELIEGPTVSGVTLADRERTLYLGVRFLETTLEACEVCAVYDPGKPGQCPNESTLAFIIDTLTK